jgi:hypothetical protein
LIPARRGNFAEFRVGDLETIGRPWLWEPDRDSLVELLRRVAADPVASRAKGTAASAWIREHFSWARTVEAVERRLYALAAEEEPTAIGEFAAPVTAERPSEIVQSANGMAANGTVNGQAGVGRIESANCYGRARVSLTMIVRDEQKNLSVCLESVRGVFDEIVVVDTGSKDDVCGALSVRPRAGRERRRYGR